VLIGPQASLMGCMIGPEAFIATGAAIFPGARIGRGAEVRIHGVVHVRSVLPDGATVPIGWVAVGDPAEILPPDEHDRIWALQKPMNFPLTVYGVDRAEDGTTDMREITRRLAVEFARHRDDTVR
jgi:carbonic anhydrase/acetyltransferase-like protein (isoleucine patch superfamily)